VLGRVGGTPLHRAAEAGHEHVVKELLELRADANVADMVSGRRVGVAV
jgi:ankyrin repeat protein